MVKKFFFMLAVISGLVVGSSYPSAENAFAQSSDPVFVGAGDISNCGSNNNDEATAKLLDGITGTIFTLGDNAYPDGTAAQFADCYAPTWGRHKNRTRPSPGNHEYHTAGASGYYEYFGASAGDPGKGYYSYNLGAWHIISLNSEVDYAASSAQVQWLRADLAANSAVCTLAYWHRPRFSSGTHGNSSRAQAFWNALYEYGADVVLNGHDHTYERFAPQNPNGQADPNRGIREFIVGTGGAGLYPFPSIQPNSEIRNNTAFGVLKLTLHATSYDWQFVPVAGQTFTDSGIGNCVGATGANPTPTRTQTSAATATRTATQTSTPLPPTAASTSTAASTTTGLPASSPTATPVSSTNPPPTLSPTSPSARTPTPPSIVSDVIFADSFESGGFSTWTSNLTDGSDLSVSTSAALSGTQGMQALIDDSTTIYVRDDSPNAEPRYRMRFYFDPNSISMASGNTHFIFKGFMGTVTEVLRMEFRQSSGAYQINASLLNDGSAWIYTNWFTISDAAHFIELDWQAATAANGSLTLWIDGVQQPGLTGIDNDTLRMDRVRIGALTGIDTATRGTYYFDAFESRRQTYIGPAGGASPSVPTLIPAASATSTIAPPQSTITIPTLIPASATPQSSTTATSTALPAPSPTPQSPIT